MFFFFLFLNLGIVLGRARVHLTKGVSYNNRNDITDKTSVHSISFS